MTDQFAIDPRFSVSVSSAMRGDVSRSLASFATAEPGLEAAGLDEDLFPLLVETEAPARVLDLPVTCIPLAEGILEVHTPVSRLSTLAAVGGIHRVSAQPRKDLSLLSAGLDLALASPAGVRQVTESGSGVVIAVIDSGFDLSHPMFRDANGNLRVDALLDQTSNLEFTTAQLTAGWLTGSNPGADAVGHGTHVAAIAGGSAHAGPAAMRLEGIAPDARFVLVKTDMRRIAAAVRWAFQQAGPRSCVANLSLGGHAGAHDGNTSEERVYDAITGPGRIVVAAAGNEREDNLHFGGQFNTGDSHIAVLDVQRQVDEPSGAFLSFWFHPADTFSFELRSPDGQSIAMPMLNTATQESTSRWAAQLSYRQHPRSGRQLSIEINIFDAHPPAWLFRNWRIHIKCDSAALGRLDGWFVNNGFGQFRADPFIEQARSLGEPATGKSVIAVASHVAAVQWPSDSGTQSKFGLVSGRSSSFSGMGPTRDGRQKPEISAPGEMITAALAARSRYAAIAERGHSQTQCLTIEGTSMASPMVCGAVALALQRKPNATPVEIQSALAASARRDAFVPTVGWDPRFGHGKLDIPAFLHSL